MPGETIPDDGRLRLRWAHLMGSLGARDEAGFVPLHRRWTEPHRVYHALPHLLSMLDLFDQHRRQAIDPPALEAAIWYHDAVYHPAQSDNEARSAELAGRELGERFVSAADIETVKRLILSTDPEVHPDTTDAALLKDLDQTILGAPPEQFDRYDRQIRAEYTHLDDPTYRLGRVRFFRSLLQRPTIFFTSAVGAELESKARENVARALTTLGGEAASGG